MSNPKKTPAAGAPPLESLAAELSVLVDFVERLVDGSKDTLPHHSVAEWEAVLKRIKTALDNVRSSALPNRQLAVHREDDQAVGVAFAAGSLPIGAYQRLTLAGLGWTFAAGLLLGLVLRRR